jgi:hypothetical protein
MYFTAVRHKNFQFIKRKECHKKHISVLKFSFAAAFATGTRGLGKKKLFNSALPEQQLQ